MKSRFFLLLLTVFVINIYGQTREYQFTIDERRSIDRYVVTDNGKIFIATKKKVLSGKKQEQTLLKLNSDFEKEFEVLINVSKNGISYISSNFEPYIGKKVTKNGNFVKWNDWLIDKDGNQKKYDFDDGESSGNVNSKLRFFSDNYDTHIGPLEGRKNYKRKYSASDIFVFSRNLTDYKTIEKHLDPPPLKTNIEEGKTISWYKGDIFDDYFNLEAKNTINKDRNEDAYHLVSYKYSGEHKANITLPIKLTTGHIILSANPGAKTIHDKNFGSFGPNNVYIHPKTGEHYVYGFYTDRPKKKMLGGKYLGYYLHKFDKAGNLIWKKQYSFGKNKTFKKTLWAYEVFINHYMLNDDQIGIRINADDTYLIYKIDVNNGKKLIHYNVDFNDKKTYIYNDDEASSFGAYLFNKKTFPKKYFSKEALSAVHLNRNIYNYVSKKITGNKIYYDAKILENGSIFLAEFNEKSRILNIYKYNE